MPIRGRLHSYSTSSESSSSPPSAAPVATGNGAPVFDVRSFGAVGGGDSDDTQAFKLAWDTACQAEESGTLLVPSDHTFMIQSTIFPGPCKSSITVQVVSFRFWHETRKCV